MTAELELEFDRGQTRPKVNNWAVAILIGVLCAIAYTPALNNGFIADDFVIMQRKFSKPIPGICCR